MAQVLRERLVDEVCSSVAQAVVVHASTGYGKSTFMRQCGDRMREQGVPHTWLTLSRSDNCEVRLAARLEAAIAPTLGLTQAAPPGKAGFAGADKLASMVSAAGARPLVIFLDELEHIQDADASNWLAELSELLPPHVRLILGTRCVRSMRLGRMRSRGAVLDVDAERLAFSLEETRTYLGLRGVCGLSSDAIARVHSKTQGWVAAVSLVASSVLRSASPPEFVDTLSGAQPPIAAFLDECVFGRQRSGVREFLLRTSVLRHLHSESCDALNGLPGSRALLDELRCTGLPILPADAENGAFRYHGLFAEFLRYKLQCGNAGELEALHLKASKWFEVHGRPIEAIEHAIDGKDPQRAIALLTAHGATLLAQGRMALLVRCFGALPDGALEGQEHLQTVRTWATYFTHGARSALALLEELHLDGSTDARTATHVRALRACLAAMADRYEYAYERGRRYLAHAPTGEKFADGAVSNAMATIALGLGKPEEARKFIDDTRRGQEAGEFNRLSAEAIEATIDWQQGKLRQAAARFRFAAGCGSAGLVWTPRSLGSAIVAVPYAYALYETDQLDQAAELLQACLPLARDAESPDLIAIAYVTLARIALSRGNADQAFLYLTELEYHGHKEQFDRVIASARMERSRIMLAQRHFDEAREEVERVEHLWKHKERQRFFANDSLTIDLCRLRWEAIAGDARHAAQRLALSARTAELARRRRRALRLRLLQAGALSRSAGPVAGIDIVQSCLRDAAAEGVRRLVLDESIAVAPVVHALNDRLAGAAAIADRPFASYVRRLASEMVIPEAAAAAAHGGPALEHISRKELRVVQLLAEGHSNKAMAQKLVVSESTVRTHLRSIYVKLDVHNRTQAVAHSRRIGLVA